MTLNFSDLELQCRMNTKLLGKDTDNTCVERIQVEVLCIALTL